MNKKLNNDLLQKLNSKFGEGTVMTFSSENIKPVDRFPSGSVKLNNILGGGWPLGRMVEIYGEESAGKSTLCLHAIAEAQKLDMVCGYIDGEFAFDPYYATSLGVDIENLYLVQPDCLESSLDIAEAMVNNGMLVIYDSTNSLPLRAEIEGDIGDHNVGRTGAILSQACRKLNPLLEKNKTSIIWVSQTRANLGAVGHAPKKVIGRGNALKFYASIRVFLARVATNKEAGDSVSNTVKMVIKKNKTFPPYKEDTVDILFGVGFDNVGELIDFGIKDGCVVKSGAWFKFIDENAEVFKAQGKSNFRKLLNSKPDVLKELSTKVLLT